MFIGDFPAQLIGIALILKRSVKLICSCICHILLRFLSCFIIISPSGYSRSAFAGSIHIQYNKSNISLPLCYMITNTTASRFIILIHASFFTSLIYPPDPQDQCHENPCDQYPHRPHRCRSQIPADPGIKTYSNG